MKERFKIWFYAAVPLFVVALLIVICFLWESYRWHTFQKVTHSDISFMKWLFLFGGNHK